MAMTADCDPTMTVFTCTDCGHVVHRLTAPLGYSSSTCFICHWLNTNESLTDKERELLRVALKPSPATD